MDRLVSSILRWGEKLLSNNVTSKFYPVEVLYPFLSSRLIGAHLVADVQGSRMFLDSLDQLGLHKNGIYEPAETEFLKSELKDGDVFVDIGANIGYYTLIAAKLVGDSGKVFAFEPDPVNCTLLGKNIRMNGFSNVVIVRKAVSDKTGETRLYLCENRGDHRLYDSQDGRKSIVVQTTRLDDYFDDYVGRIDFVKMDIQGSEGAAVDGMTEVLRRNRRLRIMMEFWPFGLRQFGTDPESLLGRLKDLGFEIYEIKGGERQIAPVDVPVLLGNYTPEKRNYASLLCHHGSTSADRGS